MSGMSAIAIARSSGYIDSLRTGHTLNECVLQGNMRVPYMQII